LIKSKKAVDLMIGDKVYLRIPCMVNGVPGEEVVNLRVENIKINNGRVSFCAGTIYREIDCTDEVSVLD
jgi:hypothetical protein